MLQKPFDWNDQNLQIAIDMWNEGKSGPEIAARFGITPNAVSGKLSRHRDLFPKKGDTRPQPPKRNIIPKPRWTEERLEEASRLWKSNMPATDIAKIMGKSDAAFADVLRRYRHLFPTRGAEIRSANRSRTEALKQRRQRQASGLPPVAPTHRGFDSSVFAIEGVKPVRFIDLQSGQCKFPISCSESPSGADMPCCGAKVSSGSYCSHHAGIARGRGSISEQKAIFVGRAR